MKKVSLKVNIARNQSVLHYCGSVLFFDIWVVVRYRFCIFCNFIILFNFYLFIYLCKLKNLTGMVCSQEELGEKVILDCLTKSEQYCCNFNGKIACCSYDEYYEEQNGPG